MKHTIIRGVAIIAAALVFGPAAGAAEKAKPQEVHRYVIVKDGKVISSDGTAAGPMHLAFTATPRGYLGVQLTDLTPELREHFRVPRDAGVLVAKVVPDSPAAKAGLRVGDIITAVDGERAEDPGDVTRAVRDKKKGDSVRLDYSRDGANGTAVATVERREVREVDLNDLDIRIPEIQIPEIKIPDMHLNEYFNSPEWKAKMKHLQDMPDCSKLDEKMRQLDRKMKELEKKLSQK